MFRHHRVRTLDVPFVASSQQAIDLPTDYLLKRIILDLYGEVSITTAGTPILSQYHPAELVNRIQVIADGRETIKNYRGWANMLLAMFRYGHFPPRIQSGLTSAVHDFRLQFYIDFGLPLSVRPSDTYLDTRNFGTLQLKIDWGANASLWATVPTAYTVQNVSMKVFLDETTEPNLDRFTINKEFEIDAPITVTQANHRVDIPCGNVISDIMINQHTDDVKTDASLNHFDLVEAGSIYHMQNIDWEYSKYRSRQDQMVEPDILPHVFTADMYEPFGTWINFKEDGLISSALNLGDVKKLEFVNNVTLQGTSDMLYYNICELIIPPAR